METKLERVIVCGSRTWVDGDTVMRALNRVLIENEGHRFTVVHGAARGADQLGALAAQRLGLECESFPAMWARDGHVAGFKRNLRMLETAPDLVLAFKSKIDHSYRTGGTEHMMRIALGAGVPVRWIAAPGSWTPVLNAPQLVQS